MIEIHRLHEKPEYYPILAHWSYTEWYRTRAIPFSQVLGAYRNRCNSGTLPYTFVALDSTLPVGMASIKNDDLWSRKDINPWLASLYVMPEFRNRGVASALINSIISCAAEMNFPCIYLFLGKNETLSLRDFYTARGWIFIDNAIDNDGFPTQIFKYTLGC